MGSKIGVMKIAAKRLEMSFDEYMQHIDRGEKHCGKCRQWKNLDKFHIDNHRGTGRASVCSECRSVENPYASLKGRVSTFKGMKHTPEAREKISNALKGKKTHLGIKHTEETKRKISQIAKEQYPRGEKHYNYKHGLSQRNRDGRRIPEYKEWRNSVFKRDKYTCQDCGDNRGGNLRAHHIKPYAEYPDLRYNPDNGVTLCHPCHEKRHFKPESIRNQRRLRRGEKLWK